MTDPLSEEVADELVRVCRTAIGDELRSVTYFSRTDFAHLSLRSDLERGEDPEAFVETERLGFQSQSIYEWSELGEYRYTIRVFEHGYVVRVIVGDHGVYVTTDPLTMELFDEVAEAIKRFLDQEL